MSLSFVQTGPAIMLTGVVQYLSIGTFFQDGKVPWKVPAVVSVWFWAFSIYTLSQEGIAAFWYTHIRSLWANQVWYDLLYSISLFWFALIPRAKAVGMPLCPWLFYICATASIGGLHMYARILYLEEQQDQARASSTTYVSFGAIQCH